VGAKLQRNPTATNNLVIAFQFGYCRIDPLQVQLGLGTGGAIAAMRFRRLISKSNATRKISPRRTPCGWGRRLR